ncbi:MAG: hypothetical protein D084_Lepto4C00405G0008 [Leptospirillum sp. Group IV 'UBA BS']|nr:MAG: hypothetical protein D084_Lepto4C00405G0008 [Leptospirillum sp. Group IV 'UBA BS']
MKKSKKFLIRYSWGQKVLSVALSLLLPFGSLTPSFALPRGGAVTKGGASLSYSTNKLLINQHTSAASFSWTSFNVKSGQSVQYVTPGSSSVSMNFIGGDDPLLDRGVRDLERDPLFHESQRSDLRLRERRFRRRGNGLWLQQAVGDPDGIRCRTAGR